MASSSTSPNLGYIIADLGCYLVVIVDDNNQCCIAVSVGVAEDAKANTGYWSYNSSRTDVDSQGAGANAQLPCHWSYEPGNANVDAEGTETMDTQLPMPLKLLEPQPPVNVDVDAEGTDASDAQIQGHWDCKPGRANVDAEGTEAKNARLPMPLKLQTRWMLMWMWMQKVLELVMLSYRCH